MIKSNSRIDFPDVVILFADLQAGIVERTQTLPLSRLKAGGGLSKLAKLSGCRPSFLEFAGKMGACG